MRVNKDTTWGEIDPDLSFLDHPAFPDSPHREEDSYADVLYKKWQNAEARVQELVKQIFGKEARRWINPDEVVAIGASVQGAILSGDSRVKEILLLDVTPLSLGIEISGGAFTRLINRNTTIPAQKSKTFTTAEDNQSSVDIHVLQVESQ